MDTYTHTHAWHNTDIHSDIHTYTLTHSQIYSVMSKASSSYFLVSWKILADIVLSVLLKTTAIPRWYLEFPTSHWLSFTSGINPDVSLNLTYSLPLTWYLSPTCRKTRFSLTFNQFVTPDCRKNPIFVVLTRYPNVKLLFRYLSLLLNPSFR